MTSKASCYRSRATCYETKQSIIVCQASIACPVSRRGGPLGPALAGIVQALAWVMQAFLAWLPVEDLEYQTMGWELQFLGYLFFSSSASIQSLRSRRDECDESYPPQLLFIVEVLER